MAKQQHPGPSRWNSRGLRLGVATGLAEMPRHCGGRGCCFTPFCGWASSGQRRYEPGPGPAASAGEGEPRPQAVSRQSPQSSCPVPRACRPLGVDSGAHGCFAGGRSTIPLSDTSALCQRDFYFLALSVNDQCGCHDSPSQGRKASSLWTSKSKHFSFPPSPHSCTEIPACLPQRGPFRWDT